MRTFTVKLTEEELKAVLYFHVHNFHCGNPDVSKRIHDLNKRLANSNDDAEEQKDEPEAFAMAPAEAAPQTTAAVPGWPS